MQLLKSRPFRVRQALRLVDIRVTCRHTPAAKRGVTMSMLFWWSWTGLNRRPSACKADALPAELQPQCVRPD